MFERPNNVSERRNVTFAMPFSSFSSGTVIRRSTSSAACPGQRVMTSTFTSPTSGYASIGRRWYDTMPPVVRRSASASVMKR